MKYLLVILLFFIFGSVNAQVSQDSLLSSLITTIGRSAEYDKSKVAEIVQLQQSLKTVNPRDHKKAFEVTEKIYEEYKVFNYDSAYVYSMKLLDIAHNMGNEDYIAAARIKIIFILLSTGLYKETYDSLTATSVSTIADWRKADYYTLWARYYFDLASYANDYYHSYDYDKKGAVYLDTALVYYQADSFEKQYYSGLLYFKQGKLDSAHLFFSDLLNKKNLTYHQYALVTSTLSGIHQQKGDVNECIELLAKATIADIKSSTKETVAIYHLAEFLFKKGKLKEAVICIENAIANAEFYGARQRKLQASSILPLIDGERIRGIEAQKRNLIKYAIVVTVLGLLLLFLIYIVLKQIKKSKHAQQLLTEAHAQQQIVNKKLEEINKRLEETNEQFAKTNKQIEEANEKLEEANKIKEEYIGYFFNMDSKLYAKLDKIKSTLLQKITDRKYDEAKFFVDKIDPKKEKEELLQNFDKLFLKLFPHFIEEVNSLLHPEEAIKLKEDELLNTDLRIFALIRMGISDTDKIAQILDYSVKTIYAYKTKLKHKSIIPNEDFEKKIMQIKTL